MGLDMYIDKFPRLGLTPAQMNVADSYFEWEVHNMDKPNDKCTFEEWVGEKRAKMLVAEPILDTIRPFVKMSYLAWDTEHNYPQSGISQNVAYWRKANQIHQYFVDTVQDGIDDCDYHDEVSKEVLEDLLDKCELIKKKCNLVDGTVVNGYKIENFETIPILEDGKVMKNTNVAEELLPTCSGCFFGGTDYDEFYMDDIDNTIDQINKILETTDFDKEVLYYVSSW